MCCVCVFVCVHVCCVCVSTCNSMFATLCASSWLFTPSMLLARCSEKLHSSSIRTNWRSSTQRFGSWQRSVLGGGQTVHSPKAQHANACFIHSSPSPPFFLFLCVIVCFVVVCRKRMSSQSLRQRQSWKQSSNCTGSVFPPNSCQSCCACARVRCACVCVVHPWDCEFTLSRCSLLHVHRIHAYQSWRVQTFSTAFW